MYPRTSSEQLPDSLDFKAILTGLSVMKQYATMAKTVLKGPLKPVQGKKTDPAHPAIHPTGEKPAKRLTPSEKKLYDLIVAQTSGGPGIATEVPAKYVYDMMFGANNLGQGFAASTMMLVTVALVVIPWAILEFGGGKKHG